MNHVEEYEQNRNDFNNINIKIPLYLEQKNLTARSANIYAPLLPKFRSTYLRTAVVSTVIKLLQAGLKS
jgi:hypothetical protein